MSLPAHIAEKIIAMVARTPRDGFHIDHEAARYGGIALMGTIGMIWLLRPDGTLWEVDDDFGKPLTPLNPEWHHAAFACGTERYPWLSELIPGRPANAIDCKVCSGRGLMRPPENSGTCSAICGVCFARGWYESPQE